MLPLLLLPLALALSLGDALQGAQVPRVTGSVELTVTNLDVVVTDKDGNHVHGLTAADFEVRHEKRPVALTNFQEYGAPTAPGPAATAAPAAPAPEPAPADTVTAPAGPGARATDRLPRTVVLFVDRLHLQDTNARTAFFEALEDLLRRVVGPGDRAMIVAWGRSSRTVVPFTGDLGALTAGLSSLQRSTAGVPAEGAGLDTAATDAAWFDSVAALSGSKSSGGNLTPRTLAAEAYNDMKGKTAALKGILSSLSGLEGRKVLVLASHRFSRYAGLEFFLGKRARLGDGLSFDQMEFDARTMLESVAETANAHGVTLYGLHPEDDTNAFPVNAGDVHADYPTLDANVTGGREMLVLGNESEALGLVAEKTGGLVAFGPAQVEAALPRLAEDLESYYSLGYAAPPGKPGRPAAVEVTVKGRGLTVRTRRSLVGKSDEERMSDRVLANLFVRESASPLPIRVTAKRKDGGKRERKRLSLEVHVPIRELVLTQGPASSSGRFSVFLAAAGASGVVPQVTRQTRPFEISARELERARASSYTYELDVDVSGPETIISVGVLDEIGKSWGLARIAVLPPADRPK